MNKWLIGGAVVVVLGIGAFMLSAGPVTPQTEGPADSTVIAGQNIPDAFGYVTDQAMIIDLGAEDALTAKLKAFDDSGKGQIAVVTTKTLNGLSVEEYAIRVAEKWKVGDKNVDNGVLVVVALDERKVRIEVGRGASITDGQAQNILNTNMIPKLKRADWSGAINDGVDEIIKLMNK